mgnify:FL=1
MKIEKSEVRANIMLEYSPMDEESESSITPNMGSLVKARLDTYRDAEDALKGQPNLDIYLDSLRNDIKLNGHEGYIEFGGDDWVEDYEEYMADRA